MNIFVLALMIILIAAPSSNLLFKVMTNKTNFSKLEKMVYFISITSSVSIAVLTLIEIFKINNL